MHVPGNFASEAINLLEFLIRFNNVLNFSCLNKSKCSLLNKGKA